MKLVIFSDIHYAPIPPLHKGPKVKRKLTDYSAPLINKLIDKINNDIKPDVVINIGDLIEDFQEHSKDIENFDYIWNILKKINVPFYSTIGNTEARSMSRDEVEKLMGYDSITFSADIRDYHLVFLGISAKYNEDGTYKIEFSNKDLEWLKKDLETNTLPSIVFTHYGLAEDDMQGNWWYESNPKAAVLQERREIKEIIENGNVIAVFSGHQHWSKRIIENNISYYLIGSLTEDINSNGIPDGVYFEVELQDQNVVDIKEYHLQL